MRVHLPDLIEKVNKVFRERESEFADQLDFAEILDAALGIGPRTAVLKTQGGWEKRIDLPADTGWLEVFDRAHYLDLPDATMPGPRLGVGTRRFVFDRKLLNGELIYKEQ